MRNTCTTFLFGLEVYLLRLTPEEFRNQYGSQSGGICSASAASNVGIPVEFWGQHGDWASFKSEKICIKRDVKFLLSVRFFGSYEATFTYYERPVGVAFRFSGRRKHVYYL